MVARTDISTASGAIERLVKIVSTCGDDHTDRMTDYSYRPRLGFDIRVRPPKEEKPPAPWWADGNERVCEHPNCREKAHIAVAKTPREPSAKIWLCAPHASAHNAQWNVFDGLSESEAASLRHSTIYGDRPTWSFARNDRARTSARARGPADFVDPLGFFAAGRRQEAKAAQRERAVSRLQAKAFETLGLPVTAKASEIRRRYAELVRRFHPDANGGDRGAEAQLAEVVKASQILKKARLC